MRQYQTYTTYSNVKSLPEAPAAAGPLELPPGGYLGLYGFLHVPWYLKLKPKVSVWEHKLSKPKYLALILKGQLFLHC